MCVQWNGDWEVAQEDLTAYKIVKKVGGGYMSPRRPEDRASQDNRPTGTALTYAIGIETRSEEPGIYCLASPVALTERDLIVLVVRIPIGTKFRRGVAILQDTGGRQIPMQTINTLCVIPLREWHETFYRTTFYCSNTTSAGTTAWSFDGD